VKKINRYNKIFDSLEFIKDKYIFYIILRNLDSETLELYSDEENYIICRGAKYLPTWIWTKDEFDKNKINEIESLVKMYLTEEQKNKFTCKKELYNLLVERRNVKVNSEDYFEMGFLICNKTKEPKNCDGRIYIPTMNDLETLTQYFYEANNEMDGVENITMEVARNKAIENIESGNFYALKNCCDKIVCMAGYNVVENQAKIGAVFTPKEERKKGYAANLIYHMTNDLLKKGYVPLLYTDYNYIPSNKAYINAGYEDTGILINFSCSKEKRISLK
jgi:predicted GNAT family acetyltransferase